VNRKNTTRKGTAVHKTYQNEQTDTSRPGVPKLVSAALVELVEDMREGLLALVVGAGLQVLRKIQSSLPSASSSTRSPPRTGRQSSVSSEAKSPRPWLCSKQLKTTRAMRGCS
jgi:hypothetical protein